MHIAFVVNNFPPRVGGVENHVFALATELVASGHTVTVFTLEATRSEQERVRDDITVVALPEHFRIANILGFPPLGTTRKLAREMVRREVDVASVHTRFFPMSIVGVNAARKANIPSLHTEHGSDHVNHRSALIRLASKIVDLTVGVLELRRATKLLAVSEEASRFVFQLSGRETTVFYNAITPLYADLSDIIPRPHHLVFVGRLVEGKGWNTFISLCASLQQQKYMFSAEILGDGPDLDKVRDEISQQGLNETVMVRGRVTQEQVQQSLRGATLINPTVLSEGFQTTLLEAVCAAGQVITYPVPGATLLASSGAPVLITQEATLDGLTKHTVRAINEQFVPVSSEFVKQWSWNHRATEFIHHCESVLS